MGISNKLIFENQNDYAAAFLHDLAVIQAADVLVCENCQKVDVPSALLTEEVITKICPECGGKLVQVA